MQKKALIICLLLVPIYLLGQKSAPVAGDAATLIDLLHKDYSGGNPETMDEDIARDRSKVISIFKCYSENLDFDNLNKVLDKDLEIRYFVALEKYKEALKDEKKRNQLTGLKIDLNKDESNYYKNLYEVDEEQFTIIETSYTTNEFLKTVLRKFKNKYTNLHNKKADKLAINNSNLSIQKGLPFVGGDILVEGIDGLARFLAKRIKEELTLNAIDNLKEYLKKKDGNPYLYELEVVLPTTVNYLKNFNADQLLNFSDDLKQYIEQDLNNLLPNAANLKATPRIALAIQKNPDLDFAFEGLEILEQVSKIKSPIDYFTILANSRNLNRWQTGSDNTKKEIAEGLQLATMLAYSLTIVENGEVKFVTTDFIANYGSQKDFLFLYFGFLHQQNIKFYNSELPLADIVKEASKINEIDKFIKSDVIEIVQNAERIHTQFLAIKKKNKNEEKVEYKEMHQLIGDILNFAEETTAVVDGILALKPDHSLKDITQKVKPYFTVARLANDITLDLHEKRYTNAITKAIEIPLTLKIVKSEYINIFEETKLTTQTSTELQTLKTLLNIDAKLSDNEKVDLWKKNKFDTEIIRLKFNEFDSGKPLATSIDVFLKSQDDSTWNQSAYDTNGQNLKNQLLTDRIIVLEYLGYDEKVMKAKIEQLLKDKKVSDETETFILNKFIEYQVQGYKKLFLGENISTTTQKELTQLYQAFVPELLNQVTIKQDSQNNKLVKFIHFVNDISVADNPEAYEKAIEAFVLPVGSSSLKEKANYYYSINAFPGLLGGWEFTKSDDPEIKNAEFIGFTAPVGIYLQPWGAIGSGYNLGLFLPIIDIAAPVRLRLDDANNTKTLPDFEIADIFSPGIYAVFGLKKSPLTFNLGVQYGPKLRDITVENTDTFTSIESYRVGLGVTLDIPLLTIASKYKNE
jgi:hypothetical protein